MREKPTMSMCINLTDYQSKTLAWQHERINELEMVVSELADCLEPSYSGSPEGREYLKKMRDLISKD